MPTYRILRRTLAGTAIIFLITLLAGCGNAGSATASTTSATPTATACPVQDSGTVQSFSGSKLLIADLQGKQVQVTFNSTTRFSRQTTVLPTALQIGERVTVRSTQNPDTTYTATQITVGRAFSQTGSGGSGSSGGQFKRGSGTPKARTCALTGFSRGSGSRNGSSNTNGNTTGQTLSGTISQVSKTALTLTDTSGSDYAFTLASTTQISSQSTATATDIQTGQAVSVLGTNNQGVIVARTVTILLHLPGGTLGH